MNLFISVCTLLILNVAALSTTLFTDVTSLSGIEFRHTNGAGGFKYVIETVGPGVGFLDYDSDGFLDIYLVNGAATPGTEYETAPRNALYRNLRDGDFFDVTDASKTGDESYGMGVAAGDYDNDGNVDIYLGNFGENVLYRNIGDGTFENVSVSAGVADSRWATSCAFSDTDRDGFLDLYAVQNFSGPQRETGYMYGGVSQLMLGDGTGYFDPVPPEDSGLIVPGDATSLTVNDINNDGRADFFVGVNNGKYMSFINQNNFNAYVLKLSDFPKGQKYIGSKIWLHFTDGSVQLHELYAGGGYLSQSAPIIFISDNSSIEKIVVQWPDGIKNEISDYKNMNDMSRL